MLGAVFAIVITLAQSVVAASPVPGAGTTVGSKSSAYATVDQGPAWTAAAKANFYSLDQGSEIMPLSWMLALQQTNGLPFMADSLSRYGYLPNEQSPTPGLPVGFSTRGTGQVYVGMTCAACHTRQIEVKGTAYRIDGGPAIVDIQSLITDMDTAVGTVLGSSNAFERFAVAVLGANPSASATNQLGAEVREWYLPFHTLVKLALPTPAWGPARLDAVGMILNRITGLDIGPPPSYLIATNIQLATAPVRYPFLWNASLQDFTQWPGFLPNGSPLFGLLRNAGEILGVFSLFHPTNAVNLLQKDYLTSNSINYTNLFTLERLTRQIGPPRWPWAIDTAITNRGAQVFQKECASCHGISPGQPRCFQWENQTWKTPIIDVGTDSREITSLNRVVNTGTMAGAFLPGRGTLQTNDSALKVLAYADIGSVSAWLAANPAELTNLLAGSFVLKDCIPAEPTLAGALAMLTNTFVVPPLTTTNFAYESRVLQGIWASAPYLHNGSVPTLAELLKPASERVASFPIGPAYDIENVGLASKQTKFDYILNTTDASDRGSGNSRAGHEYGTSLNSADKQALLEYLKTL